MDSKPVSNEALLTEIKAVNREISRLADEMERQNGTLRELAIWRGVVDERHRIEDQHAQEKARVAMSAPASASNSPKVDWPAFLLSLLKLIITAIFGGVALGAALILGYVNLVAPLLLGG